LDVMMGQLILTIFSHKTCQRKQYQIIGTQAVGDQSKL